MIQLCWVAGCVLLAAGCAPRNYRNFADREAYGLVKESRFQVLGETNAFTIETAYSERKPEEISPEELIEDRLQTNHQGLTIAQALDMAVRHSREYQDQKERLYASALSLAQTRYNLGMTVSPSSGATAGVERDSRGHGSGDVTVENGVTISRLFSTGGRLTANLLNSIMLYYTGKPELSFSSVSANLVQPLLRGFGRNNADVEQLTQAERNLVYAVRNYSFYQNQFALGIVNDYFRLLQQKDTIRNRYTNYLGRVQSTKRLVARSVDRESLASVDQARQAELSAKNSYVDALATYQTRLDDFKITLGIPVGEKLYLDDQALDEVNSNGLVPVALGSDTAFRLAVHRQLQLLNYIDQFEDSKRKVRIAADSLKPHVALTGSAALQSEGTDYTRFDPNKIQTALGLQIDLPVDRVPLANNYRTALITFQSGLRTFTRRLDDLKNSIEDGLRTLEQRRQNYEIQTNALALANRRVTSTTLLLEAGRAEVRDLLDAQDSQISAQNAVTAALVDYQQARLELMLDIGALDSDQPRFWLKDQLAGLVPPGTVIAKRPVSSDEEVPPPNQFFEN